MESNPRDTDPMSSMPEAAHPRRNLKSLRTTRKWSAKVAPGTAASQWPSLAAAALQVGLGLQTEDPEEELSIDVDVELPHAPEPSVVVEPQAAAAAPQVAPRPVAVRDRGPSGTVRMKTRPWPAATVLIPRRWDPLSDRRVWLAIGAGIAIVVMTLSWLVLARA